MKLNEGVEWALHSCSLLASLPISRALPTRKLAEYFDLPEAYLAKSLQQLSRAGVLRTSTGPGGGYALARAPEEISLLDIVEAIDGQSSCFQCTEIRRRGPTGVAGKYFKRPCGIARAMWKAEKAWRDELANVSLREIQLLGIEEAPEEQVQKAIIWFKGAL